MKSMKSVKAFLFCIAAVLTVLFAIAVSKPGNKISVDSDFVSDNSNSAASGFTEDTATVYDFSDLNESESESESESELLADDASEDITSEGISSESVSQSEMSVTETKSTVTRKQETTTKKRVETKPSNTERPSVSQTQKETAGVKSTPSVKSPDKDPEQMTVYYTKTGKRYHYANPCGKGTYYPTTLSEAKKMGLTPCQKCVLH